MSGSELLESGLCASCRHAERRASKRSTFLRCRRADADPRFARYPRLPVLVCSGFEPFEHVFARPTSPSGR